MDKTCTIKIKILHRRDIPERKFVNKEIRVELGKNKYQKDVTLKKLELVAMEAIEPAANKHCEILRRSPVQVPGTPGKSFIFVSIQENLSDSSTIRQKNPCTYSSNRQVNASHPSLSNLRMGKNQYNCKPETLSQPMMRNYTWVI